MIKACLWELLLFNSVISKGIDQSDNFESMDGFGWLQNLLFLKMSWKGSTVSVGYHSQA